MLEGFSVQLAAKYAFSCFFASCVCKFRTFLSIKECKCTTGNLSVTVVCTHNTLNLDNVVKIYVTAESVNIESVSVSICDSYGNITVLFAIFSIDCNNSTNNDNVCIVGRCNRFGNCHFLIIIAAIVTVNCCS